MRKLLLPFSVVLVILACQVVPTPPPLRATSHPLGTPESQVSRPPVDTPASTLTPDLALPAVATLPPGELPPIPYQGHLPFAEVSLPNWDPTTQASAWRFEFPVPLDQVRNPSVAGGLTLRQRNQLLRNGFVIVHSQEPQFNELRQRVSLFYGQPYLLTSDAAYHALKITYDELLRALEQEELQPRLLAIVRATFERVVSYYPLVAGTDLEAETHMAAAYLAVAMRLLDPAAALDPELEAQIAPQMAQVMAGRGLEQSLLLPGFSDDFRLYRPAGHYLTDPNLEAYYRGLTWLERVYFPAQEAGPGAPAYHVPLIVTLALRQAVTETGPAAAEWARIAETLNFTAGYRSGSGPAEYAPLMDQAYGRFATVLGLLDLPQRETFRSLLRDMPLQQIGPSLALNPPGLADQKTWSFLGVRYKLDDLILLELTPDQPSEPDDPRLLPGGLEVMAVLDSPSAAEAMQQSGAEFRSGLQQIGGLQATVAGQTEAQWSGTARNLLLESFRKQPGGPVPPGAAERPPFVDLQAWAYKELNSALGSWAELQYETSAFAPQPEAAARETPEPPLLSPPVPAFVEPDPQVFYQLARLAFTCAEGFKQRGLTGVAADPPDPSGLNGLLLEMLDLADRLQRLGDIAAQELAGEEPGPEDAALIQAPLGPAERRVMQSLLSGEADQQVRLPPLPGVAVFDYPGDRVLQVAVGGVDRIYMLTPLDGGIFIAQGGIYSYYEFSLHRNRRLTEQTWRRMLADSPPEPQGWVQNLYLPEGLPIDVLAFRIGDFYRVLPAAGAFGLRLAPARDARIVQVAGVGEIMKIIAGPVEANGLLWWNFQVQRSGSEPVEGWAAPEGAAQERAYENQDWLERAWDY